MQPALLDAPPVPLTKKATARRAFITEQLGQHVGRVLEIGALDNPTFRRELGDSVSFVDYFSTDELRAKHANNPKRNVGRMADVDYVLKGAALTDAVGDRFDVIVANHVIEHVPDLIGWLGQLRALLTDGGSLFLSVPDRRFTFDYFRPVSVAPAIQRAHEEQLLAPSKWQRIEASYFHQRIDVAALWAGDHPTFRARRALAEVTREVEAEIAAGIYRDAHCWVFTADSFTDCLLDLGDLCPFTISTIAPPRVNTSEFWVLLQPR
jgi:SAM-dependent methyltransferase